MSRWRGELVAFAEIGAGKENTDVFPLKFLRLEIENARSCRICPFYPSLRIGRQNAVSGIRQNGPGLRLAFSQSFFRSARKFSSLSRGKSGADPARAFHDGPHVAPKD